MKKSTPSLHRIIVGIAWLIAITSLALLIINTKTSQAHPSDWPTYRFNAQRTAASPQHLPDKLFLQWHRSLPPPTPAWPENQKKLSFDRTYQPVVKNNLIFIASMTNDSLTAYQTGTGSEIWRFYADAPLRFAPVAYNEKILFTSDDGFLYALNAKTGSLLWKFSAAPATDKVLANFRLTSAWPARGAPLLDDDKIYCAASIWPFMGTFIYALNPQTGTVLWSNSDTGSLFIKQPHDSPAFAGVAPQGYLAATKNTLLVPNGRAVPAAFNKTNGEFLYFNHAAGKYTGGPYIYTLSDYFFNDDQMYETKTGSRLLSFNTDSAIYTPSAIYYTKDNKLIAANPHPVTETQTDRNSKTRTIHKLQKIVTATLNPAPQKIFLKADGKIYAATKGNKVIAIKLTRNSPQICWQQKLPDTPASIIAADNKLFVITQNASLYCFGPKQITPVDHPLPTQKLPKAPPNITEKVKKLLSKTPVTKGYCLLLGTDSLPLLTELLDQSELNVIILEPDPEKVNTLRKTLDRANLYGLRASVLSTDITSLPPYFASLIIAEYLPASQQTTTFFDNLLRILRPYGGIASLPGLPANAKTKLLTIASAEYKIKHTPTATIINRPGPIPQSADFTHQYADPANTVCSKDNLVKPPFTILWFGGPSNEAILPRHGHGPSPQVAAGRLFIEGEHLLRALDVYTGCVLWEKQLPKLGFYYRNTSHHPGANEIGSNYVSLSDAVYVVYKEKILKLDPATGNTENEFTLPAENNDSPPKFGFLAVKDDYLVVTASPLEIKFDKKQNKKIPPPAENLEDIPRVTINADYASASKTLAVLNRHTGQLLWSRPAAYNFRHNSIAVTSDKIFCIDAMSPLKLQTLARYGYKPSQTPTLYAIDINTGNVIWNTKKNVFGTFLSYSQNHDVLLQAASPERDRAADEVKKGMLAYEGKTGYILWKNLDLNYAGPPILWQDQIITNGYNGFKLNLLTGQQIKAKHPISDKDVPWSFTRFYGCNTSIASQHILTFRSAAAGYFDLTNDAGTANLGGFKSGCTSNLIPANGILNAPDYTRTCTCSYQNQASLALIHNPDAETWTFTTLKATTNPVKKLGINFGAPGDRKAPNTTLWLDYPSIGGPSPDPRLTVTPDNIKTFRRHSFTAANSPLPWVTASGIIGAKKITIPLNNPASKNYTVNLYFVHPQQQDKYTFDVTIQNKTLLRNFTPTVKAIVKEFKNIPASDTLTLTLDPAPESNTIICGIELIADPSD